MPYKYNINAYDPAEYTSKAGADSIYGKRGSMRAKKNQSLNRAGAPAQQQPRSGGTPYEQFKNSSMAWANPQTFAPAPQPSVASPFSDPSQLAAILVPPQAVAGGGRGNGMGLVTSPLDYTPRVTDPDGGYQPEGGGVTPTPTPTPSNPSGPTLRQNNPVQPPPVSANLPEPPGDTYTPTPPPPNGGGDLPRSDAPPDGMWRIDRNPPSVPPPAPVAPPPTPTPPNTEAPPQRTDPTSFRDAVLPNTPDHQAILAYLNRAFGPQNKMAQQDLANILRGQAALTGDLNSGGFSEVLGRREGALIAGQQADIADKAISVTEAAKDRALEQYKTESETNLGRYRIDADKFAALMDDDTKRYGIKTNADLERYVADRRADLEKYGIDVNAAMDKYKTDSQLAGTVYSSDQAFNAARFDAIIRDQISRRNENIEWGRINLDRYGIDTRAGIDWAAIAAATGLTPQQLAAILGGFTP